MMMMVTVMMHVYDGQGRGSGSKIIEEVMARQQQQ
jgi:hypothetical protein